MVLRVQVLADSYIAEFEGTGLFRFEHSGSPVVVGCLGLFGAVFAHCCVRGGCV